MSKKLREQIKFGTDGWRGVISDNFTFENVEIVAQAIADWVKKDLKKKKQTKKKRIAVGYDARFLSWEYAQAVSCVLAANNIEVYLSDVLLPTPALSYGVVNVNGVCGVMITASHNPAQFNGIKIKTDQGGGATNDITDIVEANLGKTKVKKVDFDKAVAGNKIIIHGFMKAYEKFMKNYLDFSKIKKSKFKILAEVMNGSASNFLEKVLKGTGVKPTLMHADVNPSFRGVKPEPIAEYVPEALAEMKKGDYDLGMIFDGDADRIGAIAPGGEYVNAQRILGLLVLHLYRNKGRRGSIVKTICGSTIMDKIAEKYDLKLHTTPVGFKYISHLMVTERVIAGGEEAGGMGLQDYIPERDGQLAGLLLLEMMVYEKKNIKQILDDMEKEFGKYYYLRSEAAVKPSKAEMKKFAGTKTVLGKKVVKVDDYDGVKLTCADESWVMIRPSGTEPLVRIYAESKSLAKTKKLIKYAQELF